MKKMLLPVIGIASIMTGLIIIAYLGIYRGASLTLLGSAGWVSSSVLIVFGGIVLYFWVTGHGRDELQDKYELLNGGVSCHALGLTKHKCVVQGSIISLSSSDFIRTAAEYLSANAGYKVKDLTDTYAILTRGGLLSRQKSAVLLIYVDKENIVFEYRVAPLQASGLYDLRVLVEEVKSLLTFSGADRGLNSRELMD